MTVNVLSKPVIETLRDKIDSYSCCVDSPRYLIMSEATFTDIISLFKLYIYLNEDNYKTYVEFDGIPIAICNKLKFGEIDIR